MAICKPCRQLAWGSVDMLFLSLWLTNWLSGGTVYTTDQSSPSLPLHYHWGYSHATLGICGTYSTLSRLYGSILLEVYSTDTLHCDHLCHI